MAASVQILEWNGTSGAQTSTDKTSGNIRFKNADNSGPDLNDPMVKPSAGQIDYSYEKYLQAKVASGTYTQITNVRAYTDGANGLGTGISLHYKTNASYATPAQGTAGWGGSDFFAKTSASPVTLGAGPYTGSVALGDYLILMLFIADTVAGGMSGTETLTIAWDEI